jgi:hypothetical protein
VPSLKIRPTVNRMNDEPLGKWDQLNKCPECGRDMERVPLVGEQVGLYYRCPTHGRYRYSWDSDTLERAPER